MKINIANKLKELRKNNNLTQEDLASYLGVSFQAVSRWERNEGYPDIELLPIIANYFEVSVDELLGVNDIKNKLSIDEINNKYKDLASKGLIKEAIEFLKENIALYPNEYELCITLAMLLCGFGKDAKERELNNNEGIRLLNRVIDNSKNTNLILRSKHHLIFIYKNMGKIDLAKELVKELPDALFSYQYTAPNVLSGIELIKECQSEMTYLPWRFLYLTTNITKEDYYSNEEKIKIWEKVIKFYELVFEDKDYNFSYLRLGNAYDEIAELYIKDKNIDESINNLYKAMYYYNMFDHLKDEESFTSLLAKELKYNKSNTIMNNSLSCCSNLYNYLNENELYNEFKEYIPYKEFIEKLKKNIE